MKEYLTIYFFSFIIGDKRGARYDRLQSIITGNHPISKRFASNSRAWLLRLQDQRLCCLLYTSKGDPSLPPAFADRSIIQTEKYTPVPEGVYIMNNGTIFVSAITPIPRITGEMLEWWMIWHQLDPLRYALWNPEDHYDVRAVSYTHLSHCFP